ncbi:T9SS type B sorting domain-containing protein [Winogradskyella eckloniae]|uniref:T9SS type B sorting domain-containing protein n=1 Tax=Winogradskyella eckloniae TaxID=1089306 RepID=UPI001562F860|nr:T9SS type B sorting domain-containing protein [Winogradskyella eckloniae]NRD20872.1 T9SS type B sorting domain-containing protein [Winogradskyella eckloniae]
MLSPAGCASISNKNGDLLFYTDSENIWNRNNVLMNNGTGLLGNKNADQNSIIVPINNIPDQYYVFTIGVDGLHYSIVDMSLNNGLGEVTLMNIPLLTGLGVGKITGVHHSDGQSIWILTTKKNDDDVYTSFYAYKVNIDGSISNPIISNNFNFNGQVEGIMKFSPDGKKVGITNFIEDSVVNHLFLSNFNNETGVVSIPINIFTTQALFAIVSAYGIEFSNDSEKLYVTLRHQNGVGSDPTVPLKTNLLGQYNLTDYSALDGVFILDYESGTKIPGSLQLAKNGKIYRALLEEESIGMNNIGVIENPNKLGAEASYNNNGVDLSVNKSRLGLPNFIQSYFRTRIIEKNICEDFSVNYEVDTYSNILSAVWNFGDGNTSTEISPNHIYTNPGSYTITATITVNDREITTSKKITVHPRPNLTSNQELVQCDNNTDGISVFNLFNIREKITDPELEEELIFFESYQDAENDQNAISNPDNYTNLTPDQTIYVKSLNNNSCYSITSFIIRAPYVDLIDLPDFYTCEDSDSIIDNNIGMFDMLHIRSEIREFLGYSNSIILEMYPSLLDAQTTQNVIRATLNSTTTTIWMRAYDSDNTCMGIAPINVIVNPIPQVSLSDEYAFCPHNPITLSGLDSNTRFEWRNSNGQLLSTLQQFTPNSEGIYTHIAYQMVNGIECSTTKTFTLNQIVPPNIIDITTILNYDNNTVTVQLDANSDEQYEYSIDNINYFINNNEHTFYHVPSGEHTIYVRDIYGCEEPIDQNIFLIGYPKFITPNNDGINDFWYIKGIQNYNIKTAEIFDRYGKLLASLNEQNGFRWDGNVKGIKLPTNDYWFKVEYNNGEIKTGHFTVKH